jgi:uncharacterized membrane protein
MKAIYRLFEPGIFRWIVGALVVALLLLLASVAAACPTCKDGLAQNDPQGQAIAAGFYYSILFMMAMPYLVLGTFASIAYYTIRRARQANGGLAAEPSETAAAILS